MNKRSQQAQQLFDDIDLWRAWLADTTDKFIVELTALTKKTGLPGADRELLTSVRNQLEAAKEHLQPLQRPIRAATGSSDQPSRRNDDNA